MKGVSAEWKRQTDSGHFRQIGPFASKQILHLSNTISLSVAEKIYVHSAFPTVAG